MTFSAFPFLSAGQSELVVTTLIVTYAPHQIQIGLIGVLVLTIFGVLVALSHQLREHLSRGRRLLTVLRAPSQSGQRAGPVSNLRGCGSVADEDRSKHGCQSA